jgi:hypothetical protein
MLKTTTIGENSETLVANARFILKRVASKTYKGWDEDFDMAFDSRSIWIIDSDNHRRINGFCKVVFAEQNQRLPSEYNRELVCITKNNKYCAEVTSYIYRDLKQAYNIVLSAMLEVERYGCQICFCTVDTINTEALRLIMNTFKFERYDIDPITFPGMQYNNCNGIPKWAFLFQDKASREKAILELASRLSQKC